MDVKSEDNIPENFIFKCSGPLNWADCTVAVAKITRNVVMEVGGVAISKSIKEWHKLATDHPR